MIWRLVFLLSFKPTISNLVYVKTGVHEFSRNLKALNIQGVRWVTSKFCIEDPQILGVMA
jgi:hypothetical protein